MSDQSLGGWFNTHVIQSFLNFFFVLYAEQESRLGTIRAAPAAAGSTGRPERADAGGAAGI